MEMLVGQEFNLATPMAEVEVVLEVLELMVLRAQEGLENLIPSADQVLLTQQEEEVSITTKPVGRLVGLTQEMVVMVVRVMKLGLLAGQV